MSAKSVILAFLAALLFLWVQCESPEVVRVPRAVEKYTSKYDNIDVDRILTSKRLLISYINCLLEKGPCSPDGRELRKYVPDALASNCSRCTDIQRTQAGKVFAHLLQFYRPEWNQLIDKYDPEGNFRTAYGYDEEEDYSDLDEAK